MELYKSKQIVIKVPEVIERAILVAKQSDIRLLILTPDRLLNLLPRDNIEVVIEKPCPCGYFGTSLQSCVCEIEDLSKHVGYLRREYQDSLCVEGSFSYQRHVKLIGFNEMSRALLKQAYTELKLTMLQVINIVKAAQGIAELDKSTDINPEHVAEAISYRLK